MILLVDASAIVDLLIRSDAGESVRRLLRDDGAPALVSVAHLDAEVMSALARLHRAEILTADEVKVLLDKLGALPVQRLPITASLLAAAWGLRDNVAVRDALYVAAADGMGAKLVTTDHRLARSAPHVVAELP